MPEYKYQCDSCDNTEFQNISAKEYSGETIDGGWCDKCGKGHFKRVYTPFTFRMS
jgi:predicted nucleic acid-binding Zn ribbon protein